jgi:hypothetical protein
VPLRLTGTERRWRVEAVEQPVPVEEEQPVLRTTLRGEEKQPELAGREQLMVVQAEHDLAVAPGQVRSELEHPVGAHPRRAPFATTGSHGVTSPPTLSGDAPVPDHAASRAFPRLSGKVMTLP